ncbi:MAG TPA: hypothetical protein VMR44_10485, partial [Thermoanaerobaculia bacterium]|nr:hypothetical protein [Thermoanaerobaculia bacterium]
MNRDLQTILLRDNPWLVDSGRLAGWLRARVPEPFISREVTRAVKERWAEADRAHLVVGPRQAGKSSLLWAYLAKKGE